MHFNMKNTLKNNHNHTPKQALKAICGHSLTWLGMAQTLDLES
jgi:hypothetical protein